MILAFTSAAIPRVGFASPVPILGTWQLVGTTPSGFVRHGAQVALITITEQKGKLHGQVMTGHHHYAASATYSSKPRQLALTIHTIKGLVRLQATLARDGKRMIGTWYDSHGNDGGIVLIRIVGKH